MGAAAVEAAVAKARRKATVTDIPEKVRAWPEMRQLGWLDSRAACVIFPSPKTRARLRRAIRSQVNALAAARDGALKVYIPVLESEGRDGREGIHWTDRRQRDREAAERLMRRFYPVVVDGLREVPHVIVIDYRYWQARRCGWDMLAPEMRRTGANGVPVEPTDNDQWLWWIGLHYETRDHFVRHSEVRALRRR